MAWAVAVSAVQKAMLPWRSRACENELAARMIRKPLQVHHSCMFFHEIRRSSQRLDCKLQRRQSREQVPRLQSSAGHVWRRVVDSMYIS